MVKILLNLSFVLNLFILLHLPSPVNKPVGLHIDYVCVITMGYHKEKYYLILVVDETDFVWAQSTTTHSSPEDLILEFLNMTGIKVSTVRFDGTQEFGKSFKRGICHGVCSGTHSCAKCSE